LIIYREMKPGEERVVCDLVQQVTHPCTVHLFPQSFPLTFLLINCTIVNFCQVGILSYPYLPGASQNRLLLFLIESLCTHNTFS